MKKYASILCVISSLAICSEPQEKPSLVSAAYQELSESIEGAIIDAQEIISEVKDSCSPAFQELQAMLDDIHADYKDFATAVDASLQTAQQKCLQAYKRTLAYLGFR